MRRRRLRVEWKPQDLWVGVFWRRKLWWGGFESAYQNTYAAQVAHLNFDLWVCLLPMVPIHLSAQRCPQPADCSSRSCWASIGADR